MMDVDFLADDALVDALIMEIAGLLKELIENGKAGFLDLLGLPLSAACLASLKKRLGNGEITAVLDAAGRSEFRETGCSGVWWTTHMDEAGQVVAMLIEVAAVPDILRADVTDMTRGYQRLHGSTNFAAHARRT